MLAGILILLSFLGVLKVVQELMLSKGKNRGLRKSLDEIEQEPEVLMSRLNRAEDRNTTVFLNGDVLEIETDIHFVQLKDDGEMQLRIVSELGGAEVSGEIWMQVNAELFGFDGVNTAKNTSLLIGYSRTEKTLDFLDYLEKNYEVQYKYSDYKPAFGLIIDKLERTTIDRLYIATGTFQDGGKWSIGFDISSYSCTLKCSLESLREIENFPIFEFE